MFAPHMLHTESAESLVPSTWNLQTVLHSSRWSPFRDGISIIRLHGDGVVGSAAALLRYLPGAHLPMHVHGGFEHIIVLSGTQSDERGSYDAGELIVNLPGTKHSVHSAAGCDVLVIWSAPVTFVSDSE